MATMTSKKTKLNPVHNELAKMLTENTGRAMCDSGDHYGRNWQRNAEKTIKDFMAEPSVTLEVPEKVCNLSDISYTISLFHFLKNQLELDDLCKEFNRRNKRAEDMNAENLTGTGEKVEVWLKKHHEVKVHYCENSYNRESNLSQVIQYTGVTIDGEGYIVLQIHGGCDVRGGYTYGRLFKVVNETCFEQPLLESEDVMVNVEKPDGIQLRCSNSYNGYHIALDDDGIVLPELQTEMDLGRVAYTMLNDETRNPEINPDTDKITAWLSGG